MRGEGRLPFDPGEDLTAGNSLPIAAAAFAKCSIYHVARKEMQACTVLRRPNTITCPSLT